MSGPIHDPELAALEAALAGLAPRTQTFSRDQLLFRAGQASMRRAWSWPCAAALLAVMVAMLGGMLWFRPASEAVERIVYVPVPGPPAPARTPFPADTPLNTVPGASTPVAADGEADFQAQVDSLKLRNRVVHWGVEMLPKPPPPSSSGGAPTLEDLLGPPADSSNPLHKRGDAS